MPVRDIVITLFIVGVLPFVFKRAWLGVLLWTWLSVMNPHRLTWGFAQDMQFAAMAAGVTLIALFTGKDQVRLPREGAVYLLIAFVLWICVTTLFAVHPAESLGQLNKIIKIQLMTLVALAVIHEAQHIRWFVWVNALSIGFFGFKGGIYTIETAGGGRVWGPGGFIGGNNEIGLAILVVIPLLYFLHNTTSKGWIKWLLKATMILSAVAALGTQSRGAFLAILAMSVLLWWRSPVRKIPTGAAFVAIGLMIFTFMPQTWHDRMGTIQTYEQDGSAMGRINAWQTAINIANHRPTGAGLEMYTRPIFAQYAPTGTGPRAADPTTPRAAHSIYFQVLGEHGWIGLLLFLAIWIKTWRDASAIRRLGRGVTDLAWAVQLAGMCQVALLGYAVGGAFLSLAYFDLPFNLMVIVVATKQLVLGRIAQPAVSVAGAAAPAQSRASPGGARS